MRAVGISVKTQKCTYKVSDWWRVDFSSGGEKIFHTNLANLSFKVNLAKIT